MYDDADIIKFLHDSGANIDVTYGQTPLMIAITCRSHEALETLLELNANHLLQDNIGWNFLNYAAAFGDVTTYNLLASFELDISSWTLTVIASELVWSCMTFEERKYVSEELTEAFTRFLSSLKTGWNEEEKTVANRVMELMGKVLENEEWKDCVRLGDLVDRVWEDEGLDGVQELLTLRKREWANVGKGGCRKLLDLMWEVQQERDRLKENDDGIGSDEEDNEDDEYEEESENDEDDDVEYDEDNKKERCGNQRLSGAEASQGISREMSMSTEPGRVENP
ncbi:hypothetical protein VTJ04DRAFT_8543 [Mycothermus thermophilus]|uniref:uncharacterized protein n=1 Tax=Humicola insolens TaxID=85995 RepID=UPI0037427B56